MGRDNELTLFLCSTLFVTLGEKKPYSVGRILDIAFSVVCPPASMEQNANGWLTKSLEELS